MINRKLSITLCWLLLCLGGCQFTPVAEYDPQLRNLLVRTSVEVEDFWQQMQAQPADQRQFNHYSQRYHKTKLDFQVMLKLNQMRPNNEESIQQTQNLLTLWQQDIDSHQKKDAFKDFLLKRRIKEYQRVFTAMLAAEDAKDMK